MLLRKRRALALGVALAALGLAGAGLVRARRIAVTRPTTRALFFPGRGTQLVAVEPRTLVPPWEWTRDEWLGIEHERPAPEPPATPEPTAPAAPLPRARVY